MMNYEIATGLKPFAMTRGGGHYEIATGLKPFAMTRGGGHYEIAKLLLVARNDKLRKFGIIFYAKTI